MTKQPLRIIVVGAGYAGLLATVRLAGKIEPELRRGAANITLVNAAEVFVERLRLHQVAAKQPIVPRSIPAMLHGLGVTFVHGQVTGIDVAQHALQVQTDTTLAPLNYDYLVYALGSTIDCDSVPGARQHSYILTANGPRSAIDLRRVLSDLNTTASNGPIIVCGGGATGIEAAAEFAETYPSLRVQLVTRGEFGAFMAPKVADYMRQSLTRLGVAVRDQTTVAEVRANAVVTADGSVMPHAVCVWTGGFAVPRLAAEAGLAVNERGQILIDPFMRSVSHPEVLAVGDAAYSVETPGVPLRMAAYTAVVMGAHGADCLTKLLRGETPSPFSFAYAGQAISLGRHDAIGFNTYPNDRPHRPYFTGKIGHTIREFFVRLLADLPGIERRWPGFFFWFGKGRYAAQREPHAWASATSGE